MHTNIKSFVQGYNSKWNLNLSSLEPKSVFLPQKGNTYNELMNSKWWIALKTSKSMLGDQAVFNSFKTPFWGRPAVDGL